MSPFVQQIEHGLPVYDGMQMEVSRMLCPISEEIENDYEQDVESELAQASAQLRRWTSCRSWSSLRTNVKA